VDLRVITVSSNRQLPTPFNCGSSVHGKNSRSSVIARITRSTAQLKRLVQERITVNVADSPVQDTSIRARAQDEFGRFRSPVPVILGNSQAVADADDVGGPVATGAFDFEGAGGGFGAVDVGDVDRVGAVVEDELGGEGVGGGCEGEEGGGGEGGEVHFGGCWWWNYLGRSCSMLELMFRWQWRFD